MRLTKTKLAIAELAGAALLAWALAAGAARGAGPRHSPGAEPAKSGTLNCDQRRSLLGGGRAAARPAAFTCR